MPQREFDHGDIDPADAIIEKIGLIDDFDVFYNKVLVGVYERPDKMKKIVRDDGTTGQIIIPDSIREEDRYQGKVGLVLKIGPTAFVDDGGAQFHGQKVEKGEWVVFRPSAGLKMEINKTLCVLLQDVQIEMRVPQPDLVF